MDLKTKLAISAQDLACKSQPFTDFMFGDNIKEDHATAIKNYKLTQSVTKRFQSPAKSGRGHFSGRGRRGGGPPPTCGIAYQFQNQGWHSNLNPVNYTGPRAGYSNNPPRGRG